MVQPFQAQGDDGILTCSDINSSLLAKFNADDGDLVFEKPGGNEDQVTIKSIDLNDEGEVIGGDWESDTPVSSVIVKGGNDEKVVPVEDPKTSGSFNDDNLPGAISNVQFCTNDCDPATLGQDNVNQDNRTLSNTITDDDGVAQFTFSTLDNFTVASVTSGYTNTSGNTWEWNGSGDPLQEVDFTLQAPPEANTSTYFLDVLNECGETATFDPAYEFGPVVTETQLAGNAPNPFSGQTTIEFTLAEQSNVTVAVYDMMGRRVATLADGVRSAGYHAVSWSGQSDSGEDLASGVYLLRMQAGDQSQTRRMTIIH